MVVVADVRLFGMIHGGRDEPLSLSLLAGVLKQLLCRESLESQRKPFRFGVGQNVEGVGGGGGVGGKTAWEDVTQLHWLHGWSFVRTLSGVKGDKNLSVYS